MHLNEQKIIQDNSNSYIANIAIVMTYSNNFSIFTYIYQTAGEKQIGILFIYLLLL